MAASWQRADTTWFREAKWGLLLHYLAAPPSSMGQNSFSAEAWNERVEAFDVPGLAQQVAESGAGYLILTLGQNTGFYCSPNATYDRLVPRECSRLSRRDLVAELAAALTPHGVRMMVYLPSHAPAEDRLAIESLRCTPRWDASAWGMRPGTYVREGDVDDRLTEFQQNWEAIIREWSLRWGTQVHGWWIDGCYHADRMYRQPDAPNFRSFAEAMKAGNPASLVAFNPGVKVPIICHSEYEDYTAGEIAGDFPLGMDSQWHNPKPPSSYWGMPLSASVDGALLRVLSFLGCYWCGGDAPRFTDALAIELTRHYNRLGGVVTWDVPIGKDGDRNGLMPEAFLPQLRALGRALAAD